MVTRDVSYDLEVLEDLPERGDQGAYSPLEDQLDRIKHNPSHHAPKWARIGRYNNSAAAGAAANTLRKRHGDTPEVEGWRFETRRIDNGEATGLFAQYDHTKVIPGKKEENDKLFKEFRARQAEARNERLRRNAEKQLTEEANAGKVTEKKVVEKAGK